VVSEAEDSGSRTAARRRPAPETRPESHPRGGGGGGGCGEGSPSAEEAMSAQRRGEASWGMACWGAVADCGFAVLKWGEI
jgi:hypothetical protein